MTPFTQGVYYLDVVSKSGESDCTFVGKSVTAEFGRTNDATSTATVKITSATDACSCLPVERSDELRFQRADSNDVAWQGPVTVIDSDPDNSTLTITAQDRTYWWQGCPVLKAIVHEGANGADPIDIATEMIRQFELYQPSRLLIPADLPPLYREAVTASHHPGDSLWAAFLNLAKGFLDFTVSGLDFYYGGREIPIVDGPALRQSTAWVNSALNVQRTAVNVCTQVRVTGAGGVVGVWPAVDIDLGYGRSVLFVDDATVTTVSEATALARFSFDTNQRPSDFMVSGTSSLGPGAPVTLTDLVPGRKFLVVADRGCLQTEEVQRLHNVKVSMESGVGPDGGWALLEKSVAVDLQRAGTTAPGFVGVD
jgi:hypothetical protein